MKVHAAGQKAREAGLRFHIRGQARESKARAVIDAAGKRSKNRRGKKQKRDGGRDGIPRQSPHSTSCRLGFGWSRCDWQAELSKHHRLAGLHAHAGEVEAGAYAGECGFDQVEFARGDAAGDEQKIGRGGASEGGVERLGGIARDGQDPRRASGCRNHCGQHGAAGVANLAGLWFGGDGHKFVACGENGHARFGVDLEICTAAGRGQSNLRGVDQGSGGQQRIAFARLRAAGHDVLALLDGAWRQKADGGRGGRSGRLNVFEHDDGVGAARNGRAGHDFPDCAARQRPRGRIACAGCAGDRQRPMRGGFRGAARESVARGAGEGGLVGVGAEGFGETRVRRPRRVLRAPLRACCAQDARRVWRRRPLPARN